MASSLGAAASSNLANKPLLQPNLSSYRGGGEEEDEVFEGISGASASGAVFNVVNSIVGAGIMALPATQKQLGIIPGTLLIILLGILTDISVEILIRFSKACKVSSYSSCMGHSFGIAGRTVLQLCIIINNLGYLIVYMIIIGDILSGTTKANVHHTGVLEEWGGGSFWWNRRVFILFLTTVLVVIPLVSLRRVDSLRFSSAVSVALAVVFVLVTALVASIKLVQGTVDSPRLVPEIHDPISFLRLFTAVPVIVTAYICHHNIHPIANELDESVSMYKVNRISITICTVVYVTTSLFGYVLFGENTMDDVLANFDADLGIPYGRVIAALVRVGYVIHLMLVFPLIHFSLRINLDSLLFPSAVRLVDDHRRFILLTALLILVIFVGATSIPNIWTVFQFTGATGGVAVGFIFPGIIALRDKSKIATTNDKFFAWIMVVLAVVSSISSISTNVHDILLK